MRVEFQTIIRSWDKWVFVQFLADILGLRAAPQSADLVPVRVSNGITLDYAAAGDFSYQHYAFLLSEPEFDAALSRISPARIPFYATYRRESRGEINNLYGGRGVYFDGQTVIYLSLLRGKPGGRSEFTPCIDRIL